MEDEIKSQGASEANNNQNSGPENSKNYSSGYGQNAGRGGSNNSYQQLADDRGESWPSSDNNNQNFNNNQGFSNNNAPQFNQPPVPAKKSGVLKWVLIILIAFVALSIVGLLLFFFLYIPSRPEYRIAKMAENSLTKPAPQTLTTIKFSSSDGSALFGANGATIKLNSAMSSGKIQSDIKIEDVSKSSKSTSISSTSSSSSGDLDLTNLKGAGASVIYADGQMYFKVSNAEEAIKSFGLDSADTTGFSFKNNQWYSYKLSNLIKNKDELSLTTCILSKTGDPLFSKGTLNKYIKVQDFLGLSSQFTFTKEKINGQDMLVATLNSDQAKNVDETLETEESIEMQKNIIKDSSMGSCFTDQQITDFVKQGMGSNDSSSSSSDSLDKFTMKLYVGSDNQLKRTDISGDGMSILMEYTQGSVNIETPSGAKALDN
jgi:hypothetical protein